ncbi:MAG: PAS domain S-box protein [Deltaproteobacteria bacterium]|nr:PAS domain S-box protein [Deltaproteobacteria bacterium]
MKNTDLFKDPSTIDALLQSVTDYVIGVNKDYQIIMANDLFKSEFGMAPGKTCFKAWKKMGEKCENCLVEMSFTDGQPHTSEETVILKDGRTAQMRIRSTPVKNGAGDIVYVLETATDLTEQERLRGELNNFKGNLEGVIEDRLRHLGKSEEKYRSIFERSLDAIFLTDSKGKILEINPAALRILGFESREETQQLGSSLTLFEDKKELALFQEKIFRDGYVTEYETRLRRKNGEVFHALVSSNVILDVVRQITGYVIIVRDITRMKRAMAEIEKQNQRLAALNTISMKVNSSLDLDDVLNSTIEKMLEIVEPDSVRIYLLNEDGHMLDLVAHKGLSARFIEKPHVKRRRIGDGLLGETAETGRSKVVDNLQRLDHPHVESVVEEGLKSTLYLPLISGGKPVGVMCVSSHTAFHFPSDYVDFLTGIGHQIGMAVHNAELYKDIKNAYQELKEAQEQVIRSEKLASLGKLSATIAHEINNPIAAVLTYIRLMMKLVERGQYAKERKADISRYLDTMASEMSRCGDIVKNLLAFSRRTRTDVKPHAVPDIVQRTLALISHDLELKQIQVKQQMAPDLPEIQCDFRQIQQALLNLISNASEAMDTGGTLTLSARQEDPDSPFVAISVADTGCGISKENQKDIFEPFFTTKDEGKGVGLGLSVVYGIITNHNGSIELNSEEGKGSVFTVRLPTA